MITLIKVLGSRLKAVMARASRAYVRAKYGPKSDVCIVAGYPGGMVGFYTSLTSQIIPCEIAHSIRRTVGDNILRIHGLPLSGAPVPHITLILTPPAMWRLGAKGTWRFLRDWRGDSKVGELVVVKYSIF